MSKQQHSPQTKGGSKSLEGILRRILESACEEHKASLSDLTVLSAQVDPYRIDTAAGHRDGQWLAEQLARLYGPAQRAHWRGIHYAIVSDGKIRKPNGEIYRNTNDDWEWLIINPAKAARWLGYVSFDRIIDQRNSPPIIHRKARVRPEARLSIGLDVEIRTPRISNPCPSPTVSSQGSSVRSLHSRTSYCRSRHSSKRTFICRPARSPTPWFIRSQRRRTTTAGH